MQVRLLRFAGAGLAYFVLRQCVGMGGNMEIGNALNQQVEKVIEEHWPKIQTIFREKVGAPALAAAKNDKAMKVLFTTVYKQLPLPIRLVIKKDVFVAYCFKHRDKLV